MKRYTPSHPSYDTEDEARQCKEDLEKAMPDHVFIVVKSKMDRFHVLSAKKHDA